jgi:hypothetical protein
VSDSNIYVALIHFPVKNKKGLTIGSALTSIDLHDIARACVTFGLKGFYVVSPYEDQIILAKQIMDHWCKGVGSRLNPHRKKALELIRVSNTFEEAIKEIEKERLAPVITVGTSAQVNSKLISPKLINMENLRQKLNNSDSYALIFGTAWGLADELLDKCDYILEPIKGNTDYNHLSVRSAVSIYLDRIVNSYRFSDK